MDIKKTHELIYFVRQNDLKAFNQLVKYYWEKLFTYAFKLTDDRMLAQSIVQNIFVDLWEKRQSVQIENPDSYFFRAVKFQVFKSYRDQKMKREILQEKFEDYLLETEGEYEIEMVQKLHQSIDRLPDRCREILKLNRLSELSIDQIATQLNLSKQTVKNQLSKAFFLLRADLRNN
jgi:RNA polymerase sigma-70 factor (ECF subfamily)